MLRHSTTRSLLLIDEFGKGTSSIGEYADKAAGCLSFLSPSYYHKYIFIDGVSLLTAVIRDLLNRTTLSTTSSALVNASPKVTYIVHIEYLFVFI